MEGTEMLISHPIFRKYHYKFTYFLHEKAITSPDQTGGKVYYQPGNVWVFYGCKLLMRIARSTCALLTIWLQRMFENGNIIPVYSPLVHR